MTLCFQHVFDRVTHPAYSSGVPRSNLHPMSAMLSNGLAGLVLQRFAQAPKAGSRGLTLSSKKMSSTKGTFKQNTWCLAVAISRADS